MKFNPNKVGRWAGQDTFPDRIYVPADDYDRLLALHKDLLRRANIVGIMYGIGPVSNWPTIQKMDKGE
jgi:hypothetical protein